VGWALLLGMVMALLGAILPVRTIAKLAPAEVFRR
jgi:ABC-type antimicrobial peptide transport system permease subunit